MILCFYPLSPILIGMGFVSQLLIALHLGDCSETRLIARDEVHVYKTVVHGSMLAEAYLSV